MASETIPPHANEKIARIDVTVTVLFGAILAAVGLMGPVLAGSDGNLLIFGRNYLHDVIHLASGLGALAAGYYAGGRYAGTFLKSFGAVYLVVTLAGFALAGLLGDLIALNMADNFLHLAISVVFLGVGFGLSRE